MLSVGDPSCGSSSPVYRCLHLSLLIEYFGAVVGTLLVLLLVLVTFLLDLLFGRR